MIIVIALRPSAPRSTELQQRDIAITSTTSSTQTERTDSTLRRQNVLLETILDEDLFRKMIRLRIFSIKPQGCPRDGTGHGCGQPCAAASTLLSLLHARVERLLMSRLVHDQVGNELSARHGARSIS